MTSDNKRVLSGKASAFVLGLIAASALFLLTGAVDTAQTVLQNNRYQLSSWGMPLGSSAGVFGAFVMDSNTGETKLVYAKVYGEPAPGKIVKDDLGKPFVSVQ